MPELYLPFPRPANTSSDAILDRMTEEGPWYALGPGKTFADMVSAALATRGRILCPECRRPLRVGQEKPSGTRRGTFLLQWGLLVGMVAGMAASTALVLFCYQGDSAWAPYRHLGLFVSDVALGVMFGATLGGTLGLWAAETICGQGLPSVRCAPPSRAAQSPREEIASLASASPGRRMPTTAAPGRENATVQPVRAGE